jgi:hypothetical protein
MKTLVTTLFAGLALLWAPMALADIAPDPGDDDYTGETDDDDTVDTCTAEVQEDELPGFTCEECVAAEMGICGEQYEGTEYELVCFDEGGDSVFEVWCAEDTGPGPVCAVVTGRSTAGAAAVVIALGVVGLLRRRATG